MSGKTLRAMVLMAGCAAMPVWAETAGPAELPPEGFAAAQYIDSRGCVFLRASYGQDVLWLPRLTVERQPMCGYPPSVPPKMPPSKPPQGAVAPAADLADAGAAAQPQSPPQPQSQSEPQAELRAEPAVPPQSQLTPPDRQTQPAPARTPALAAPTPAERAPAAPAQPAVPAASGQSAVSGVKPSPPVRMPAVKAVAKPGKTRSAAVAALPRAAGHVLAGVLVGADGQNKALLCPVSRPLLQFLAPEHAKPRLLCSDAAAGLSGAQPPRGDLGAAAWDFVPDLQATRHMRDREMRVVLRLADGGHQTRYGQVVAVDTAGQRLVSLVPAPALKAKPPANAAAATAGVYIAVGAFAQPGNAQKAAARLRQIALPVGFGQAGGGSLQLVVTGPFTGKAALQTALAQLRAAGFTDTQILR